LFRVPAALFRVPAALFRVLLALGLVYLAYIRQTRPPAIMGGAKRAHGSIYVKNGNDFDWPAPVTISLDGDAETGFSYTYTLPVRAGKTIDIPVTSFFKGGQFYDAKRMYPDSVWIHAGEYRDGIVKFPFRRPRYGDTDGLVGTERK